MQAGLKPVMADQLIVRAGFGDAFRLEGVDHVDMADGGQAMGDHQGGALGHQALKRILDGPFGIGRLRAHAFELACTQNDFDQCLTKPKHPWANGQVERMNRTIKEAAVKRFFYDNHAQLRSHLDGLRAGL